MNDEQIDKAETLASYYEQHREALAYGAEAVHREWWMRDAAALLRDLLPEWSAFHERIEECTPETGHKPGTSHRWQDCPTYQDEDVAENVRRVFGV